MASITNALGTYLRDIPDIQGLVYHDNNIHIYQGTAAQGALLPYIILQIVAGTPDYHLGGEIGDLNKIVQVDCYAATEIEAEAIADAVRLAPLSGYTGLMHEIQVKWVQIVAERELLQGPVDSSGRATWRKSIDYRITFERPVYAY